MPTPILSPKVAGPRINGTLQPIRTSLRTTYDPQKGFTTVEEWESAGNNLNGTANAYEAKRSAYDHTPNERRSKLVATSTGPQAGYGGDKGTEKPVDTWQVIANEIQKDIKTLPSFLALENAYPGIIGYVEGLLEAKRRGEHIFPNFSKFANVIVSESFDAIYVAVPDDLIVTAMILFNRLSKGVTHYATSQYVLRHTTNASNEYGANVADTGIESIYTPAQLEDEIKNINYWGFPCPGRILSKLEAIPAPANVAGYRWGWRKLPSTETTAAGGRIDISTEYWLEQWDTYIYPAH